VLTMVRDTAENFSFSRSMWAGWHQASGKRGRQRRCDQRGCFAQPRCGAPWTFRRREPRGRGRSSNVEAMIRAPTTMRTGLTRTRPATELAVWENDGCDGRIRDAVRALAQPDRLCCELRLCRASALAGQLTAALVLDHEVTAWTGDVISICRSVRYQRTGLIARWHVLGNFMLAVCGHYCGSLKQGAMICRPHLRAYTRGQTLILASTLFYRPFFVGLCCYLSKRLILVIFGGASYFSLNSRVNRR